MVAVAMLALSAVVQPVAAAACPCPEPLPGIEDLLARDDVAVFSARVRSVLSSRAGHKTVTRLEVGDVLKGDVPPVVEMIGVTPPTTPAASIFAPGRRASWLRAGLWTGGGQAMPVWCRDFSAVARVCAPARKASWLFTS
jgi:hypothetical protein